MAFPQFQDATTSIEGSYTTTHTINLPATKTADDIWVLTFGGDGGAGTITGPSGWTEVINYALNANQIAGVWIYRATGSEGSTATITTTGGNRSASIVRRYSAVSTEDIEDVWSVSLGDTDGFSAAPDPGSVTASWGAADNLAVALSAHMGSVSYGEFTAYPASYVDGASVEQGTQVGVAGADREVTTATEDPATFTLDGTSVWFAVTLILKPVLGLSVTVNDVGTATDVDLAETDLAPRPADGGTATDTVGTTLALADPPQEFPVARLGVKVELWLPEGPTIGWVDVSDRLVAQGLDPARGRADESSETDPASLTVLLDNADGWLTPGNANSPWYPGIDQGMQVRLSVEAGDPALVLDGQGSYAVTPDHPDYATTDIDIRARIDPTGWGRTVTWSGGQPLFGDPQRIVSKWVSPAGGDRELIFYLWGDGYPAAWWSSSGTNSGAIGHSSVLSLAAVRPTWVAWTVDMNDGGGSYVSTLWRSDEETPPADVTSWNVIEQKTGTASTLFDGNADMVIGALSANSTFTFDGRILEVQVRGSINGPLVANPRFTDLAVGTKSFVDGAGKSWSLGGQAEISRWRARFVGTADEILPFWPHGDNEPQYGPLDLAGEEITLWDSTFAGRVTDHLVQITANGILRRLAQGADPLGSVMIRHITGAWQTGVDAYWPVEDPDGAAAIAPGVLGHTSMVVEGDVKLGADDSFIPSAPLATIENGKTGTVRGTVTTGNSSHWSVEWHFKLPEAHTSLTRLITVRTPGETREVMFEVSDVSYRFRILAADGSTILSNTYGAPGVTIVGDGWKKGRLDLEQSGSDLNWEWTFVDLSEGGASSDSGTVVSTATDRPSAVEISMVGPASGYSFGHIIVLDGSRHISWLAGADSAWVGESAAYRFKRLCLEEGIPCELVGEHFNWQDLRGDVSRSLPMGPQGRKTLLELLNECVKIDGVMMIERQGRPGLVYRLRGDLENQVVRLSLDASSNQIINPLEPKKDDQRLRNDVEVKAEHGTSTRVIDQDSIDKRNRYRTSETVAGVGGVSIQRAILNFVPNLRDWVLRENGDIASLILHLGTWPGMRYPTLTIPLDIAPELIPIWADLELGDRIQVSGLPAQLPDETIELIVERINDQMTPTSWRPELTCSPGGPWIFGELQ